MQNHSALQAEESRSYQTSELNAAPAPNLNQMILVVRILELSMASPAFPLIGKEPVFDSILRDNGLTLSGPRPGRFFCIFSVCVDLSFGCHDRSPFQLTIDDLISYTLCLIPYTLHLISFAQARKRRASIIGATRTN